MAFFKPQRPPIQVEDASAWVWKKWFNDLWRWSDSGVLIPTGYPSGATDQTDFPIYQPSRNILYNGAFQVWQRGTTFVGAGAGASNLADRWQASNFVAANFSMSRQTGPTGFQYCARIQRTAASAGVNAIYIFQNMETVESIPLQGKAVTFSGWVRVGANFSASPSVVTVGFNTGTGTDQNIAAGYTGLATVSKLHPVTTTWSFFQVTGTVATNVTEIGPFVGFTPTGVAGANDYFEVAGLQLEVGSRATAFAMPSFATELARCSRFYQKSFDHDTAPVQNSGTTVGAAVYIPWVAGARTNMVMIQLPQSLRVSNKTPVFYNPSAANSKWRNVSLGADSGTATLAGQGKNYFGITNTQVAGDAITHFLQVHWSIDAEL